MSQALLFVLPLLLGIGLWIAVERWYGRWTRQRRWHRAQAAEAAAPRLLRRCGFDVLGAQVEACYSMLVDGQPTYVRLRADYIAVRQGKRYVAEVKSGRFAPQIGNASTRRQLLEYLMAFSVDGIVLVDGEAQCIHEIVFPGQRRPAMSRTNRLLAIALVACLCALVGLILRKS
jgi:hypothetical protein